MVYSIYLRINNMANLSNNLELEQRLQSSEKEAKKYWDLWNQAVEAETTLQAENKLLKRRLQSAYSDINESKTVEDLERLKEQISLLEPPVAEIFPDGGFSDLGVWLEGCNQEGN